jgi:uncharacterized membrane protein YphA (DoxX/SURF4 family)
MTYTTTETGTAGASKRLHVTLWAVQIVLALIFAMTGTMKVAQPIAALAASLHWPGLVPPAFVRFLGVAELLGAAGLILPAATRIAPALTPVAAGALTLVMVPASLWHISRGEFATLAVPVVVGALSAFVAWGRSRRAPIAPR